MSVPSMPRSTMTNRFAAFTFRFFWERRRETPDECGQRTFKLLHRLKKLDPIFNKWHENWIKERKSAGKRIRIETSRLSALIARDVWRDSLGASRSEWGYNLKLWSTDAESHYTEIDFDVGSHSRNCITIRPPYTGWAAQRVWNISVLTDITKAVVETWEPNCGELYAHDFSKLVNQAMDVPRIGWITYLSKEYDIPARLPKPARVLEMPNFGAIIITRARFSFSNVDHGKHYKQLSKALNLQQK